MKDVTAKIVRKQLVIGKNCASYKYINNLLIYSGELRENPLSPVEL